MLGNKFKRFFRSEGKMELVYLQSRGLLRTILGAEFERFSLGFAKYRKNLKKLHEAPFPMSLYRDILSSLVEKIPDRIRLVSECYGSYDFAAVVRHDIDLEGCVQNLEAMIQVEKDLGIRSSNFFRVDGLDYDPKDAKALVTGLKKDCFEVGLHSTAYIHADPRKAFEEEIHKFEDYFGFFPQAYNFHGGLDASLIQRIKLSASYQEILPAFPFLKGTDSPSGFYAHRVQDCHGSGMARHVMTDFANPPIELFKRGNGRLLILTHPVYWQLGAQRK